MSETKENAAFYFRGVFYRSLSEACETMGVEPTYVYNIKQKEHITGEEALEHLLQYRSANRGKAKPINGRRIKISINGRQYDSYADALAAYKIPRITVTSYMQRSHKDFRTALMTMIMRKYELHIHDLEFDLHNLAPVTDWNNIKLRTQKFYQKICDSFEEIEALQSNSKLVLKIIYKKITCYVYFFAWTSIGIIVPELMTKQPPSKELFLRINTFNKNTESISFGYQNGVVNASTIFDLKAFSNLFLTALFDFLNTCSDFLDGKDAPQKKDFSQQDFSIVQNPQEKLSSEQLRAYNAMKDAVQTVQCSQHGEQLLFSYPLLLENRDPAECFSIYDPHFHRMFVPEILKASYSEELMQLILQFNYQFSGCKIWYDQERLSASWKLVWKARGGFEKILTTPLHRFLNSIWFFSQRLNQIG